MDDLLREQLDKERAFIFGRLNQLKKSLDNDNDSVINIFKFILENATDGYWDWHIKSDYEYLSKTFKKQLGYDDDEMRNHPSAWMDLANKEDLQKIMDAVNKHFNSMGEIPLNETIRFTHKDGHEIVILCKGKVIEWNNKEPIRMVGTHTIIQNN